MRKLLMWVGILSLLVWTAAGAAAWLLVKERVQITVTPAADAVAARPDPIALVRDDVAGLRADLTALTQLLSERFTALARELERAPDPQLVQLAADVAALRAAVARLDQRPDPAPELLALRTAVASLGAASTAPGATSVTPASVPAAPPVAPDVPVAPATLPESRPVAPEAPPRKKSFLAFELPSDRFAADQLQKFVILPSLSRVGFDGKSTLHDFTGVTSQVAGELVATLARPDTGARATIVVEAKGLDTGLVDRNAEMYEHLDTDHHAQIRFELASFKASAVDPKAMTAAGDATGRMTIRGVTRELVMPVKLSVDEGRRLRIEGEVRLKLTDFQVPVPSKLGVIGMQDEVKVWIALRARWAGRAGGG
jgi:polyisoprenoid-binding protein YceI